VSAACGLVCDECDIYQAGTDGKGAEAVEACHRRERGVEVAPEEARCEGCRGARQRHWSPDCWILGCGGDERGLEFCSACSGFPCQRLTEWASNGPRYADALKRG